MVALDGTHQVKLHAAIDLDVLVLVRAMRLTAELGVPDLQPPAQQLILGGALAGLEAILCVCVSWLVDNPDQ